MVSENLRTLMKDFIQICKTKGFHKETAAALGTLAGSVQAHTVYGNTENAFKALVEIAKNSNNEQDLINAFSRSVSPIN